MKVIKRVGKRSHSGTERDPERLAGMFAVHGHPEADTAARAVTGAAGPATAVRRRRI